MEKIRKARSSDRTGIWNIFHQIILTGDTYAFPPETTFDAFKKFWFAKGILCFVLEDSGVILGSYILKPNQPGLGSHVANASYIVNPEHRSKGLGKKLCNHSINGAIKSGYLAMQFNIVVSTNKAAIALWKKLGFEITGITPLGFKHQKLGFVDTYIMYRKL